MNTELMIKRLKFVNNKDCALLRNVVLGCDFSDYTLEISINDSGEVVFCLLDLFIILGILVIDEPRPEFDMTPLLQYGYDDDQLDAISFKSRYDFKTVVDICIKEHNGLKVLSSLCGYLKSFGSDYFNKWYSKHLKDVKLLESDPFYLVDMEVLLCPYDFKYEKDNLCGVVGDLYVLEFSTGVIKVGKSSSGSSRIKQHAKEAGRYLVKVVNSYVKHKVRLGEDALLDFCNKNGNLFYGKEYFKDLKFNKVKEFLSSV